MKKIIASVFLMFMTVGISNAAGIDLPAFPIGNEIGNMQNTNSQMRLMNEQRFRQEEYNDYKNDNIKEVQAQRAKQYQQYQEEKQKLYSPSQNLDIVRENGRLILKSTD